MIGTRHVVIPINEWYVLEQIEFFAVGRSVVDPPVENPSKLYNIIVIDTLQINTYEQLQVTQARKHSDAPDRGAH